MASNPKEVSESLSELDGPSLSVGAAPDLVHVTVDDHNADESDSDDGEETKGSRRMSLPALPQSTTPKWKRSKRSLRRTQSNESLPDVTRASFALSTDNQIHLNVGGQLFVTSLTTMSRYPSSLFGAILRHRLDSGSQKQPFFIDRDPTLFHHILNFLRDGDVHLESLGEGTVRLLHREAAFYQLQPLLRQLNAFLHRTARGFSKSKTDETIFKLVECKDEGEIRAAFDTLHSEEGYDFVNWLAVPSGYLVVFSKKLSHGEISLLDRLGVM